ncbi:MAG TPA: hypothetical protein VJG64_03020 [Candidatus Paceibacterota bacterium]
MGKGQNILTARINTIIGSVFLTVLTLSACLIIWHAASGETNLVRALSVEFDDSQL